LVEALIVSSMLMTMMAGGLFMHRHYAEKLRVMRESRLRAWQPAVSGCATGLGIGSVWNMLAGDPDPCGGTFGPGCSIGGLSADNDAPPPWLGVGAETQDVTGSVSAHSRLGGTTYAPHSYNRVVCNETPQDPRGDALSILGYVRDSLLPPGWP
jgi:hypothetical protein